MNVGIKTIKKILCMIYGVGYFKQTAGNRCTLRPPCCPKPKKVKALNPRPHSLTLHPRRTAKSYAPTIIPIAYIQPAPLKCHNLRMKRKLMWKPQQVRIFVFFLRYPLSNLQEDIPQSPHGPCVCLVLMPKWLHGLLVLRNSHDLSRSSPYR